MMNNDVNYDEMLKDGKVNQIDAYSLRELMNGFFQDDKIDVVYRGMFELLSEILSCKFQRVCLFIKSIEEELERKVDRKPFVYTSMDCYGNISWMLRPNLFNYLDRQTSEDYELFFNRPIRKIDSYIDENMSRLDSLNEDELSVMFVTFGKLVFDIEKAQNLTKSWLLRIKNKGV
ncbi:hypothetical protein E9993_01710 [Labilibacter sediminis]|nr:hypothetical protein E9993_01710 [Labilibacter sediminis]